MFLARKLTSKKYLKFQHWSLSDSKVSSIAPIFRTQESASVDQRQTVIFNLCFFYLIFFIKIFFVHTGISSNSNLLGRPLLRYGSWIISIVTIFGNLLVFWGRYTFRDETRSVGMVIRNLALSDCLMGVYVGIVAFKDMLSRDNYLHFSSQWISLPCTVMGAIAVVSAEVSLLILAFMSIERFLLISNPFGSKTLNEKNIYMSLYVIWLFGICIAVYPIIFYHSSTMFYGYYNGGTCFPLFMYEKYLTGWQYSAFIFIFLPSGKVLKNVELSIRNLLCNSRLDKCFDCEWEGMR